MGLLTSQIILAACVVSAHAMSSPLLPKSVSDDCPSAQAVSSTTISVDGQEILRESFVCPDGKFVNHVMSGSEENVTAKRSTLEAREEIECMFPQNMPAVCQCGAQFTCGCFVGTNAPEEFDCTSLLNSVTAANEEEPTFTVQPNGIEVVTLRTCSLVFTNLQSASVEYCWDNLVSLPFPSSIDEADATIHRDASVDFIDTVLVQNFIGEQSWSQCVFDESDGVVGGLCKAGNGQYTVSLGPAVAA